MRVPNVRRAAIGVAALLLVVVAAARAVEADADSPPTRPPEELVVTGRQPGGWPPPTCDTSGALVEFHSSDGFSYNDDLIIRPSGRGSLCWGRRPGGLSGRVEFVAGSSTMERLAALLGLVYCEGESPEPERPEGADIPVSSLAYYGPDLTCGDSTEADREAAYREASDLVGALVVAALVGRRS